MDVRIIRRIRAKKAKQTTTPTRSNSSPHVVPEETPRSTRRRSPSLHDTTPIEIASGSSNPTVGYSLAKRSQEESDPEPLVRKKSKDKKFKGKEVAASSKRNHPTPLSSPKPQKKAKAVASTAEEAKNFNVVDELKFRWKEAQIELLSPSFQSVEMEEEKLIPDWHVSTQSSVLKTLTGHDSWKLFKSSFLPRDQALLTPLSHIRMEQNSAHSISQVEAFSHQLSLKCTHWCHEKLADDKLLEEKNSQLVTHEKENGELEVQKAQLVQLRELNSKVAATVESFSAGRVASREESVFR
ncbi:UNVERIFIED_CONTAM: hypothetical protein Sindi_2454800 [Sesamum indicum]